MIRSPKNEHAVLVATEDPALNSLLQHWIDGIAGFHCVATCRSVEETVSAARTPQLAAIVVSYRLQDGTGTMAVRLVRQSKPEIGAVVIVGDPETRGTPPIALRPAEVLASGSLSSSALRDALRRSVGISG